MFSQLNYVFLDMNDETLFFVGRERGLNHRDDMVWRDMRPWNRARNVMFTYITGFFDVCVLIGTFCQ